MTLEIWQCEKMGNVETRVWKNEEPIFTGRLRSPMFTDLACRFRTIAGTLGCVCVVVPCFPAVYP